MYEEEKRMTNEDDFGFGENTPVSRTKGSRRKSGGKKPVVIAAAVAAAVAVVVLVVSLVLSSPVALVGRGLVNSVKALEKNDVVAFVGKVAKGGSVEAVVDVGEMAGLSMDCVASVKLYTDIAKAAALIADVEVEGESVVDVSAYANKENVAVASDVLFGSESFGLSLADFAARFNDSEFGPNGEFYLGIELDEDGMFDAKELEKLAKDSKSVAKAVSSKLMKSIKEHTKVGKKNESLTLNDNKVRVTAVEIEADGEALAAVMTDLLDYLCKDEDLEQHLYNYADYYAMIINQSGLLYGYYGDAEDTIDAFYDMLHDLNDEVDYMAEELEDTDVEIKLTFYITKSGKELIGVKFDGDADGDKVKMSVVAGPSWKNLEEIAVEVNDGYSKVRMNYTVETNNKKEYSAKLKVREDSETIMSGEVTWDKKDGDFVAGLTDDWGDTYGIEAILEVTSKTAVIELESVYEDSYETELGISLALATSDKMPAIPDYTDLLDMTAGEIQNLVSDLEAVAGELSDMFYYYMFY